MKIKKIQLSEILEFLKDNIIKIIGDYDDVYIDNLADYNRVNQTTLDWINPAKNNKQELAKQSKAKVLLVDESIDPIEAKILIVVGDPKVALAQVGNHFFVDKLVPSIHPTAIIDKDAQIGKNVYIGPYSVIGKAVIGDGCVIDSNVRIFDEVVMGENCNIKAGVVLGSAGFGFEKDKNGNRFRFPQIGSLLIGDDVEIGANTCIDRGALSDTIIGNHVKINNLCHIAHNNVIGDNVEITGCVNISGGNIIDDNVWISPNASLVGYVHIGKNAVVGMGAVVIKNIPEGETWVGNPAHKLEKKL